MRKIIDSKSKDAQHQISFRISKKLAFDFKDKLKRESRSVTLFFVNAIKDYLAKSS
jgi:hypothetical protein